jgi:hypothetical protein
VADFWPMTLIVVTMVAVLISNEEFKLEKSSTRSNAFLESQEPILWVQVKVACTLSPADSSDQSLLYKMVLWPEICT